MNKTFVRRTLGVVAILGLLVGTTQRAKTDVPASTPDKEFLSTAEAIKEAAQRGAPTAVWEVLEHGQMVECLDCISYVEPLLFDKNQNVREIAAWWIRQRPFGYAEVALRVRKTIKDDADPVRRAAAANALGEFLDPGGTPLLIAATKDGSPLVRAAAVSGLRRMNDPDAAPTIAAALSDSDASVRRVAIDAAMHQAGFADTGSVAKLLSDSDLQVRALAADALGTFRVKGSIPGLQALAGADADESVRIAAANAMGEIGDASARATLEHVALTDTSSRVRDAARIAGLKLGMP